MPIILGSNNLVSGYEISNSMRFGGKNGNAVLQKTFSSDGNRKKFTIATWVKVHAGFMYISGTQTSGSNYFQYGFTDDRTLRVFQGDGSLNVETTKTFGDTSGWYHIVLQMDTTQGTNSNRVKFYINGVQETSMASTTWPNQNLDLFFNKDSHAMGVGNRGDADGAFLKGYLADYYFVDNATVAPSTFAETDDNGIWIPKDSADVIDAVTFGTNGFFMNFQQTGTSANSSGMGADTSGNDNHFVSTNTNATNITTDTPSNNFCTINPNDTYASASGTIDEGMTKLVVTTSNLHTAAGTIAPTNGKWYWEVELDATDGSNPSNVGISNLELDDKSNMPSKLAWGYGYNASTGDKQNSGNNSSYGNSYGAGDIVGVAMDLDNGAVYFSKNGTFQASGDPTSGATKTNAAFTWTPTGTMNWVPYVADNTSGVSFTWLLNFGNPPFAVSSSNTDGLYGNFEYAVPSGYYALCTKRLAQFG